VRTTENIARVRRDEAKAAEEEREMERRRKLAEQEARTDLLRSRARAKLGYDPSSSAGELEQEHQGDAKKLGYEGGVEGEEVDSITNEAGHVNFFQNLENGEKMTEGNEENAAEKKREQEEYEKKVGYLTYLGQDTEELTGEKVWWRKLPERQLENKEKDSGKDVGSKQKNFLDPLLELKKRLGCEHEPLSLKKHEEKKEIKAIENGQKSSKLKRKRSRSSSSDSSHKHKKRKTKKRKRDSSSDSDSSARHKKKRKSDKKQSKKSSKKKEKSSKKKKRKSSESSSDSSDSDFEKKKKAKANLEKLRQERLMREKAERSRANKVLYGETKEDKQPKDEAPKLKQSYNSQFNPEVARQNKLDPKKKYWLE